MRRDQTSIEKHTVPVRVLFPDGAHKNGLIFLRQGQRVMDLLSDERPFFPLKTVTSTMLINKNNISAIELVEPEAPEDQRKLFPPFDWKTLDHKSW